MKVNSLTIIESYILSQKYRQCLFSHQNQQSLLNPNLLIQNLESDLKWSQETNSTPIIEHSILPQKYRQIDKRFLDVIVYSRNRIGSLSTTLIYRFKI